MSATSVPSTRSGSRVTAAAAAGPVAELILQVGFLGVGADLEQVGDRHVARRDHGHGQRRAGQGPRAPPERDLHQDPPGRQVEQRRLFELGLDRAEPDPAQEDDPGQARPSPG